MYMQELLEIYSPAYLQQHVAESGLEKVMNMIEMGSYSNVMHIKSKH